MLQPPSSSELVTVEVVSAGTLDTSDKTEDTAYPYSMTEPFLGEMRSESEVSEDPPSELPP